MTKPTNSKPLMLAAALLAAIFLAGCSVRTGKDPATGKDKDVDIKTPFGSLSVREGGANVKDTGLPAYPGARPKSDYGDKDNANVNISSSLFGLKVVVQKYESDDSSDQVLAFYEKSMGKYGKVIQCSGGLGHHSFRKYEKDDPVTCDDGGGEYTTQIKVGTQNNQHIVAVKSRGSGKGSEFVMVFVRAWDGKDTI